MKRAGLSWWMAQPRAREGGRRCVWRCGDRAAGRAGGWRRAPVEDGAAAVEAEDAGGLAQGDGVVVELMPRVGRKNEVAGGGVEGGGGIALEERAVGGGAVSGERDQHTPVEGIQPRTQSRRSVPVIIEKHTAAQGR